MARRLGFSVVGLPHYTIWHLYEPSVEDLHHMEEMAKENKLKEAAEKAAKETLKKVDSQFENPSKEWQKEKKLMEDIANNADQLAKAGADKKKSALDRKIDAK
jgi:mannan polymerase II complex ANP1 subunit